MRPVKNGRRLGLIRRKRAEGKRLRGKPSEPFESGGKQRSFERTGFYRIYQARATAFLINETREEAG